MYMYYMHGGLCIKTKFTCTHFVYYIHVTQKFMYSFLLTMYIKYMYMYIIHYTL